MIESESGWDAGAGWPAESGLTMSLGALARDCNKCFCVEAFRLRYFFICSSMSAFGVRMPANEMSWLKLRSAISFHNNCSLGVNTCDHTRMISFIFWTSVRVSVTSFSLGSWVGKRNFFLTALEAAHAKIFSDSLGEGKEYTSLKYMKLL